MKRQLLGVTALAVFVGMGSFAYAHLTYSGRVLGSLEIDGEAVSSTNQTVSSSFGWADGTDADWGDSHRIRAFRFALTNRASVTISVQRNGSGNQTNGGGVAGSFLPAFSLFYGLAQAATTNDGVMQGEMFRQEQPGHDGAALSVSARPESTEGSFRALTDWSIGNEDTYVVSGNPLSGTLIPARLVHFTYVGHMADGDEGNVGAAVGVRSDGQADGFVSATFDQLPAGDYSLFIGGANYDAQTVEVGGTNGYPTYGIDLTVRARSLGAYEDGVASVLSDPAAHDLYPPSAILDMNLGGVVIQGSGTNVTLLIQPQWTANLDSPFEDFGEPISVSVPLDEGQAFLRVTTPMDPQEQP